jgi:hypothetical protein
MDELQAARAKRWWLGRRKIGSLTRAGAFVEDLGFALLFPNKGVVLPSLYEAASDQPLDTLGTDWGPDADRVWGWKDELPRRGLAWYGKFLRGRPSFLAPQLLADLYPRAGRPEDFADEELSPMASRIARILLRSGPQSTAALREALDVEGRRAADAFSKTLTELGRALVITHYGIEEQGAGWPTPLLELTARAFPVPRRRDFEACKMRATRRFIHTMLVAQPHELGNAFGWGAIAARACLEELVRLGEVVREGNAYRPVAS